MKKSRNAVENSSSVSIRKAPLQNMLSSTNEHEKVPIPILEIDALRIVGRLVRTIRAKIESEYRIVK
jgi:hypothetical protein